MRNRRTERSVPDSRRLLERWRNLAVVEALAFDRLPDDDLAFVSYRAAESGVVARLDDFSADGGVAYAASDESCTIFAGASKDRFCDAYGREIEQASRQQIRALGLRVGTLLPRYDTRALGWTFAMYSSDDQPWTDLTGLDSECWRSAQFPNCWILYADTYSREACEVDADAVMLNRLVDYCMEQFELTRCRPTVRRILQSLPISTKAALSVMKNADPKHLRSIARLTKYPIKA